MVEGAEEEGWLPQQQQPELAAADEGAPRLSAFPPIMRLEDSSSSWGKKKEEGAAAAAAGGEGSAASPPRPVTTSPHDWFTDEAMRAEGLLPGTTTERDGAGGAASGGGMATGALADALRAAAREVLAARLVDVHRAGASREDGRLFSSQARSTHCRRRDDGRTSGAAAAPCVMSHCLLHARCSLLPSSKKTRRRRAPARTTLHAPSRC